MGQFLPSLAPVRGESADVDGLKWPSNPIWPSVHHFLRFTSYSSGCNGVLSDWGTARIAWNWFFAGEPILCGIESVIRVHSELLSDANKVL